jgi:hypothetical protein
MYRSRLLCLKRDETQNRLLLQGSVTCFRDLSKELRGDVSYVTAKSNVPRWPLSWETLKLLGEEFSRFLGGMKSGNRLIGETGAGENRKV